MTTSEDLISVLGPVGQEYARLTEYAVKVDLSYIDPILVSLDRAKAIEKIRESKAWQDGLKEEGKVGRSRKQILANYLRHVHPFLQRKAQLGKYAQVDVDLDDGLLKVFDKQSWAWLQSKREDITDVMNWAWILTSNTSERAALRLMLLADRSPVLRRFTSTIPPFLLLFLLRRSPMNAQALKILLVCSWRLLKDVENPAFMSLKNSLLGQSTQKAQRKSTAIISDAADGMSERIFIILIVRLLRQARQVWPASCESIVALLTRYFDGINFQKNDSSDDGLRHIDVNQLTYVYNTVLRLLSLPSSLHPFQSLIFQQRAQFSVLRKMNEFDPPLGVDKRGYQAVARMQLMHRKTLKEREWAQMKAKSWPPWKENKLGIDAAIGVDSGISRAKEALHQSQRAGYSQDHWDDVASILSGWDTDGSPTIQTRSITEYPPNLPKQITGNRQEETVWAARIQATRTLEEAWSCFLSWKDQNRISGRGQQVYHALFAKVVLKSSTSPSLRELMGVVAPREEHLPGDSPEVFPASVSPYESIYIRRPPPNEDELLQMMKEDGIEPLGRLLTFLLSNAWSFQAGVKILETSAVFSQHVPVLLSNDTTTCLRLQETLSSLSPRLFASLIHFLTRFAPTMSDKYNDDHNALIETGVTVRMTKSSHLSTSKDHTSPNDLQLFNPLFKAYKLLKVQKPKYRPAWYHVLRALSRPKAVTGVYSRYAAQSFQDIQIWRVLCKVLDQMADIDLDIDLDGFGIICVGFEKAIFASERHLRYKARFQSPSNPEGVDGETGSMTNREDHVLTHGLSLVKGLFKDAVRSTEMQQQIPKSKAKEKSKIDNIVKSKQDKINYDKEFDEAETGHSSKQKSFLPPGCLLPRLLEVPNPTHLHALIRILGLRRDYDGLVDLVEWMSLFADEINALADETHNGKRMMRRCVTAVRVFLERSWMDVQRDDGCGLAGHDGIVVEAEPAPAETVRGIKAVVAANGRWGGWASDDEVVEYCLRGKFL